MKINDEAKEQDDVHAVNYYSNMFDDDAYNEFRKKNADYNCDIPKLVLNLIFNESKIQFISRNEI